MDCPKRIWYTHPSSICLNARILGVSRIGFVGLLPPKDVAPTRKCPGSLLSLTAFKWNRYIFNLSST